MLRVDEDRIEELQNMINYNRSVLNDIKADSLESKLSHVLFMEHRNKPSDGPKYQPKYNEY